SSGRARPPHEPRRRVDHNPDGGSIMTPGPLPLDRPATVVITGAFGLIGGALTRRLGRHPDAWRLILVDDPGLDRRYQNAVGVPFADFWSSEEFLVWRRSGRTGRLAAVVHLGACTSTTESDGDFLMRNNFAYSRDLVAWCLERGVRILYASSAATYGDGGQGCDDDEEQLSRLHPLNKYAFSKHAV